MLPYQQNLYKKNNKKRYRIRLRYIALPLIALGLMSFLFLLFSDTDENISIEVAKLPPSVEQIEKNLLPEIEPKKLISLKKELLKPVIKTEEIVAQKTNIAKELNKIEPAAGNKKKYNGLLPMRKPLLSKKINLPNLSQNNSGQKRLKVGKGDTLMNMLTKECKANYREAYNAIDALGAVYDPRNLKPGHEVLVYFKDDNARHELMGLEIQQDLINTVLVQRLENGDFVSGKRERPVKRILKGAKGEINSSLYVSADKMDVPDSIILSLIRTFSWGVDFQRDIRAGDKFEVMYEQFITEDGKNTGKGDILYATLILRGEPISIYRYKDKDGNVDYFEPTGSSVRKTLMKTPIDGARISSGFGRRKHPVLGYSKMHKGVDFAAPTGTPIYAAGDGVIEKLGRWSSYGKYIRIRHHHGLKTAYAHMNGYKRGLKTGSRVKQGDVIGYVGATGRVTGAHLHYEVLLNGRQSNPRKLKLPKGNKLTGNDLSIFKGMVAQADINFEELGFKTYLAENNFSTNTKIE